MAVKTIARWTALGALFLIPFIPLVVGESVDQLFNQSNNPITGAVLFLVFLARLPFVVFGVFYNLFFPFITAKAFIFRFLVEIAVAGWVVLACVDARYRPRFSWIGVAACSFVAWMFIADLFAPNAAKAFFSNYERMEGWVLLIHLLGFFIAASAVLRVEQKWRAWFFTSLGVSVVAILYSLLQLAGALAIHQGSTRLDATFGNSTYFAIYLLFNVFIAGWLALTESKAWLKYSLLGLAALEIIFIFLTQTRGTILGLIGALSLSALLTAFTVPGKPRTYAISVLATVFILVSGFLLVRDTSYVKHSDLWNRLAHISLNDGQARFMIWGIAWHGFMERPIVGWGQEGFNYAFNKYYDPGMYAQEPWFDRAHNAFIDWLMAGGLPAFLLYLSLFGSAIYALWRSTLARPERIALTAVLTAYAFHNLFVFDNLYSYVYFFAILAVIDSQVGRPMKKMEAAPVLDANAAGSIALPIAIVGMFGIMYLVNIPGLFANVELIQAITPQPSGLEANIAHFENLTQHPGFAAQEMREQLVSFALQVTQAQGVPDATKSQVAALSLSEMKKQLDAYPDDARERLEYGLAYRAAGDVANSLKQIQIAHTISPKKEQILLQIGATMVDMGNAKGARDAFQEAYTLGPQFPDLAAYAAAGDLLVGDVAGAHSILIASFGTTTVDNDVLNTVYYQTKDYKSLIALWQLRTQKPGASASAYFTLAGAYYLAGDTQRAIDVLNYAAKTFPETVGDVQAALNQIKKDSGVK